MLRLLSPELVGHYEVEIVTYCSGSELFDKVDAIEPRELRDAFIVCDLSGADPLPWSVRHLGMFETGLSAALLLAFPEPQFVFVGCQPPRSSATAIASMPAESEPLLWHHFVSWAEIIQLVELLKVHDAGLRMMFDPTGIRALLKSNLFAEDMQSRPLGSVYHEQTKVRLRQSASAADEESSFLYLNGYSSYKAGFRTWLVNSDSEFHRLFPPAGQDRVPEVPQMRIVLSDWDLAFADHEGDRRSSYLMEGAELADNQKVAIITTFVEKAKAYVGALLNRRAARSNDHDLAGAMVVPKPYPGIYYLLTQIGEQVGEPTKVARQGNGVDKPEDPDTHSLPFARRLVVERLLKRAARLGGSQSESVEDSIHVALLALEAKEMLGALSLTTYYEALALQHEAEVRAEVCCFGTAAQLEARKRLDHLQRETEAVAAFQSAQGGDTVSIGDSRLNFLVRLSNQLRRSFSDNEQVAAAEQCLEFFAHQKDKLARRQGGNRFALAASRYIDWVTGHGNKISKLLLANAGLVVSFSLIYMLLLCAAVQRLSASKSPVDTAWIQHGLPAYAFGHAAFTFLELQPGLPEVNDFLIHNHAGASIVAPYLCVLGLEILVAYLHLGLLISMLYRKLTRHAP